MLKQEGFVQGEKDGFDDATLGKRPRLRPSLAKSVLSAGYQIGYREGYRQGYRLGERAQSFKRAKALKTEKTYENER